MLAPREKFCKECGTSIGKPLGNKKFCEECRDKQKKKYSEKNNEQRREKRKSVKVEKVKEPTGEIDPYYLRRNHKG